MVTGQKPSEGNPCVIVVDTGEGQKPEDFKDTLVFLLRSNKTSVPFVQGKFNMGSTGSLTYCSPNKNYQLIASRRNSAIPGIKNPKWGFTVVRKRPPLKNEKNERYEYLAPKGKICELDLDEILIYPDDDSTPYKRPTTHGTIVKLFEYDLPGSTKTMATVDFYRALSSKLWTVVVPMRIHETRGYKGHTLESTFSGMNIRLEDDKGDVLEEGFPCNFTLNIPKVGMVDGRICLFKKNAEISRWVSSREAIIYTINGQSHGALPNDFFRRQSVNLPWVQKQLLINVDCSRLDQQLINRVFMTSRDRQRDVKKRISWNPRWVSSYASILACESGTRDATEKPLRSNLLRNQNLSNCLKSWWPKILHWPKFWVSVSKSKFPGPAIDRLPGLRVNDSQHS
jgi:hypothetical protein